MIPSLTIVMFAGAALFTSVGPQIAARAAGAQVRGTLARYLPNDACWSVVRGFIVMGIVASVTAAKLKTALTYCAVGALSVGVSQVYERHAPKPKARVHKVVSAEAAPAAACLPPSVPALFAPGARIEIAASLPVPASARLMSFAVAPGQMSAAIKEPVPADVPEPAAFALFGLGALAVFRRR